MRLAANCKQRDTQSGTVRAAIGKRVSAGGGADQQEKAGKTWALGGETIWRPPVKEAGWTQKGIQVEIKPEKQKSPENLRISRKQEARSQRPYEKEEEIFYVSESKEIFLASIRSWAGLYEKD